MRGENGKHVRMSPSEVIPYCAQCRWRRRCPYVANIKTQYFNHAQPLNAPYTDEVDAGAWCRERVLEMGRGAVAFGAVSVGVQLIGAATELVGKMTQKRENGSLTMVSVLHSPCESGQPEVQGQ